LGILDYVLLQCDIPSVVLVQENPDNYPVMFVIGVLVNVGMWFERFVITVTSLSRDFLPSSWAYYKPTLTDFGILIGSFGLFFTLLLLFTKTMPVVSMAELKAVSDGAQPTHDDHHENMYTEVEVTMNNKIIYGVTGLFNKPNDIIKAAKAVAEKGYKKWDVNTPYPVHGMDQAMKLKPSTMGFFALGLGLTGTFTALFFIWWTMVHDYPIVIGGKPFFAFPAFIPVMFEVTVIMATIGSVLSMLFVFFKVPNNSHPLHDTDYMKACTSDHFGVCLEAKDPNFDEAEARALLESLGASNVTTVYYDNEEIEHNHRIFHPKFIGFLVLAHY
jgi:hypothetical protein